MILTHSFCALTCVYLSKKYFLICWKLLLDSFWSLVSAPSNIQESHFLYSAHYLTILLKYIQWRKQTAEVFFNLKKCHIYKGDEIPRKKFSHLEFWASSRLDASLSDCKQVHAASHGVIVVAGIEWICLLVAGTVVQFALSMRIMLITEWWFSCCSAVLTKSRTSHIPVLLQWADAQEFKRRHDQDS